jgi:hypothetical protein
LIAQGYRKITSTSNTNKIATRKYFTENGIRAFPIPSTPHSKFLFFYFDFLLGPSLPETIIVPTTNPAANKTVIKLERNLTDQIA